MTSSRHPNTLTYEAIFWLKLLYGDFLAIQSCLHYWCFKWGQTFKIFLSSWMKRLLQNINVNLISMSTPIRHNKMACHVMSPPMACHTPLESYILGLSDDVWHYSVGARSVEKIAFDCTYPISKIHPKIKSENAMGPVISIYLRNQTSYRNLTPLPWN